MSLENSKPAPAAVVVAHDLGMNDGMGVLRLLPAASLSLVFHAALFGLFFLLAPSGPASTSLERTQEETPVTTETVDEEKKDPFLTTDVDPAGQEIDTDINYNVDRKAEVSVPGSVNLNEAIGIANSANDAPPVNLPAPGGFTNKGQGGAFEGLVGNSNAMGDLGGYGARGMALAGGFGGRSGATRDKALREGGGTMESEAAVTAGLRWLARNQFPDGSWRIDGNFPDKGTTENDIAGTAFGLLPLLAAGKTHKPAPDNPFDKPVEKGLLFLIRKQDKKTGNFGGGMYGHGLAAIAMCEAYGMTQDPALRRPAQMCINFIVSAQHEGGGWRYSPGQAGDTSVSGWHVMALKSAQMAGLDVPEITMKKAQRYLDSCVSPTDEGYGYVGPGSTPTMTAVGLLCRQYLQSWGPQNIRLIKAVDNHMKMPPTGPRKHVYYNYYATQVLHHFGGEAWTKWNNPMREFLIKTQDRDSKSPQFGSWAAAGDPHGASGGRLMITSLNLLTLEVYYRHLPLYYREAGGKAMAAKK